MEGTVLIEFLIDVDGRVTEVVIVEDIGAGCGEAAKAAIENCVLGRTFLPGELMGEATPMVWRIPVKFGSISLSVSILIYNHFFRRKALNLNGVFCRKKSQTSTSTGLI